MLLVVASGSGGEWRGAVVSTVPSHPHEGIFQVHRNIEIVLNIFDEIIKRWGCDWVRCSVCRTEICWVTKQPRWGPKVLRLSIIFLGDFIINCFYREKEIQVADVVVD